MRTTLLYPLLLCGVLLCAGCQTDTSPSADAGANPEAAAADTTARANGTPGTAPDTTASDEIRVLVLGNSIAAGYGLNPGQSFPALLQQKVDSLGWNVNVVNAGLSGETTAGGLRRIDWLLRQEVDVLVLELGGNDGLRGTAPEATRENLQAIIDKTLSTYPEARVILAGMQLPPNLGQRYTEQFRAVYPTLAEQNERVELIPFILEGVGGVPSLMQSDGIHPTAEGQQIVAQNVWDTLRPVLRDMRQRETAASAP